MKEKLLRRTRDLAILSFKFSKQIENTPENQIIKYQFVKSSTSMAANYRAALRARSRREYYSKICIVVEETDETNFWATFIKDAGILANDDLDWIENESMELLKIFSTTKSKLRLN